MYRFMDFCTPDTQSSEQDVHYSIHSFHEGAYLCRKQINKHGYEKQLYQTDPTCQPFLQRAWLAFASASPTSGTNYLSGTGIDNTVTWDFLCSKGQNSGKWKKIEVPCNWELQGFGEYTYGRWYTIKGERPSDETGIYRYKFESPATTPGERIKIFFDGVMTDTEVFINGKPAGEMHQGGFYRFSYDITDLLKPGKKEPA